MNTLLVSPVSYKVQNFKEIWQVDVHFLDRKDIILIRFFSNGSLNQNKSCSPKISSVLLPLCVLCWVSKWLKVDQSCLTLCDSVDYTIHILQARILEWVAISFSKGSSQPRDWTQVSHIAGRFLTVFSC